MVAKALEGAVDIGIPAVDVEKAVIGFHRVLGTVEAFRRQYRRPHAAAGGVAGTKMRRHRSVRRTKARALRSGYADRPVHFLLVQLEQVSDRERDADRCGVSVHVKSNFEVRGRQRQHVGQAALQFDGQGESVDEILTRHAMVFAESEQRGARRTARMRHRCQMGVVERHDARTDAIDECRVGDVGALAISDDRRLRASAQLGDGGGGDFHRLFAATAEHAAYPVQESARGLGLTRSGSAEKRAWAAKLASSLVKISPFDACVP